MKNTITALLTFASFSFAQAQWAGPTGGTLSTGNSVQITNQFSLGMPGSPPPAPLLNILSDDGGVLKPIFAAGHSTVDFGKPLWLNNTTLNCKRANNATAFQVMPLGNLTLNTDGATTANRGFFINSDGRNFFKVTETELLYSDANQDLFKVNTDGHLFTRKVVVTLATSFPDYVFANTYKLTPILELEAFIKQHQHLPNIPSAAEVQTNNNQVDVGDLQVKLLEKVEELTLYIIQLQKEIDLLKQQQAGCEQR